MFARAWGVNYSYPPNINDYGLLLGIVHARVGLDRDGYQSPPMNRS